MGGLRQAHPVTQDENTLSPSIKPSTKQTDKQVRQSVRLETKRTILTDKSNRQQSMLSTLKEKDLNKQQQQQHTQKIVKKSEASAKSSSQPKEKKEAVDPGIQAFFQDNKERYPENEDFILKPTPVLPIIVPDRIKAIVREKYLLHTGTKRSFQSPAQRSQQLLATLKKQKSLADASDDPASFGKENIDPNHAPALTRKISFSKLERHTSMPTTLSNDPSILDSAKKLDQEQEEKAKNKLFELAKAKDAPFLDDVRDPMLVAEYAEDIHRFLMRIEKETMPNPGYMKGQPDITWRMRNVLVDWVVEVHFLFMLLPETMYLAVNIIDRFLSNRSVSMCKLQLIGITSLFIACKFEESVTPPVAQFLFMTGNTIYEEDMLTAERYILQCLDFQLGYPNPLHFFRRITSANSVINNPHHSHVRHVAKYFMEISCVDHRFMSNSPSLIAAAALFLAMKCITDGGQWNSELVKLSGYTVYDVKPAVELLLDYLSKPMDDEGFYKKWKSKRLGSVTRFVRNWVGRFYKA
ncbi:A/B/D/E cyclin [Hesseltinella vesiculosa]|uniref:A/B/D/E cyclin n=1 Tax=Hesseltinella vesiculosa TaxID=101127 RepID=A0A1X2GVL3_9FUNG|nr:A/B/D/E cyclin [Hesseltinella vesiculosa]